MASNLRVDTILPSTGTTLGIGTASGTINFLGNSNIDTSGTLTAASASITGNLGVGGTLTYEDVTNIDSVGIITARSGIRIGATGANTLITGNGIGIGIGITTPQEELHIRAATPVIRLEDGDNARQSQIVGSDGNFRFDADNSNAIADTNIAFRTDGSERLRIGSAGQIGIAGANYGTSGQVLTSQGSGSAVQWATPAAGWVHGTEVTLPTNASYYTFTNVPDGASHIRYLIRYMSFAGVAQAKMQVEKSTTGGSKSIITSNYVAYSNYLYNNGNAGGGNTDGMDLFDSYSNPANSFFGSVNVYRIGSSGSDGTNYFFEHQGVNIGSGGSSEAVFQSNGYIELGSNTTDFISGVKFWANTGENFDNGYIQQSYLLS